MIVRLRTAHPRGAAAARRLRRRAREFLAALGRRGDGELSVLVVTDRAIRGLNRRWRGVDRATDVLSFPTPAGTGIGRPLGDVVISLDTASRRARAEGRELGCELDRYLAHGLLHLLGYDHRRPRDAKEMAAVEVKLVKEKGLVAEGLADRG